MFPSLVPPVRPWRCALAAAAVVLLAGCAAMVPQTAALRTDWPAGVPRKVDLSRVPFFPQADYQCGPAALATVLGYSGVAVDPEALVGEVWLPGRSGSLQLEMLAAPRRHGRVAYQLAPHYGDLLREVAAGNPVVVLQDVGLLLPQWHYAVVNGFDYGAGTIFLRSGRQPRQEMAFTTFERTWRQGGYWAIVVLPPGRLAATATEERWMEALAGLARGGDVEANVKAYAAARRRWPGSLPAAVGLANNFHALGMRSEAADVLRDALERHPQSLVLLNNLAQTLSDLGRQAEALVLIERAGDPRSPFAGDVQATRQLIRQRMAP